tara:strand:- start:156 stop:368 length:213 start_codon:yes stop_codon:yes gene_type:complete
MAEDKICCLCDEKIYPTEYWDGTHNALPVKEGRCCAECDKVIVIPARLAEHGFKEPEIEAIKQLMIKKGV